MCKYAGECAYKSLCVYPAYLGIFIQAVIPGKGLAAGGVFLTIKWIDNMCSPLITGLALLINLILTMRGSLAWAQV